MEDHEFFNALQVHFDDVLPFVAYRKPNEKLVKALLQQDDQLHYTSTFTEKGFVFAPFDTDECDTILIPSADSSYISFEESNTVSKVDSSSAQSNMLVSASLSDSKDQHIKLVKKAIKEIKRREMKKVVLSRKQTISSKNNSPINIFKRLLDAYPTAFVYCWYHPKVGLWLGATPETLLSVKDYKLKTMSLAGTQQYGETEDVEWGQKELEEQALVTESIVKNLTPIVGDLTISPTHTFRAGNLLHLRTHIETTYKESESNLNEIVKALHPTPAVCGLPKTSAYKFIANNENYHRSYYTGFLGELNVKKMTSRTSNRRNVENLAYRSVKKETHLFVNLRCMEIDAHGAQLYVGGGITANSDPLAEWEETVHKLQTMLKVL